MKIKKIIFLYFPLIGLLFISLTNKSERNDLNKPNIIFIAVDDLRPQLNCYGKKQIHSPNIDSLASNSHIYKNAVCNIPVCGASRASVLTGLRPNYDRFTNYKSRADEDADHIITMAEWFKSKGYYTLSNGKILHVKNDSPESWSLPAWRAEKGGTPPFKNWRDYQTKENLRIANDNNGVANAFEVGIDLIEDYADTKMVNKSIKDLYKLKDANQPFFLALGFLKPHLPFNAPKEFWDLYPISSIELAKNRYQPKNSPNISMHTYGELRKYTNIPDGKKTNVPDSTQKKLIQGYYSCVSYIDYELGRFVRKLKELNLYENSIIVLWGDHGWQLGEHNLWAKHCNYQTSLKVPLIIKYPNQKKQIQINTVVELLDIYPTLCELSNIDKPKHLQGRSLVNLKDKIPSSSIVYSKYHKGYTATNSKFSYTEWKDKNSEITLAKMMYDLEEDPNENVNISEISSYKENQFKFSIKIDSIKNLD